MAIPVARSNRGLNLKARQRRFRSQGAGAASSSRHRNGIRKYLLTGFAVGIVLLLVVQLTALTRHVAESSQHEDHESHPMQQALREQKQQHDEHHQKIKEEVLLLERKTTEQLEERKRSQGRRRLNSTRGNQSNTDLAPKRAVISIPKDNEDKLNNNNNNNTVVTTTHVAATRRQGPSMALRPKPMENVTEMLHRRYEMMYGNVTGNMTETFATGNMTRNMTSMLVRREPPKKKLRPFKLKRSIPQAPSDFLNRKQSMPVDPLGPHFDISTLTPTNYTLKSKWHGVLLDAGRHYFEIDWIKRMLDVLAVLQYNCLHFRLTDDQSFNVRLDSQPDLAHNVGLFGNNKTYTPTELRDIVAYAKTKNITIWPEINVPGHGGGWAGIPGLIVQCPEFICEKGYGVPINVTHPKFRGVLTDVLREIVDIFDDPPYLHLGGDEVDMSQPCFNEIGQRMFDYEVFEKTLKLILDDINYPEEQVIRWEMTGQRLNSKRTGKMPQYWFRIPGESTQDWGRNKFFASGGLYFDFNEMDMAWQIYLYTRRYYHLPKDNFPIGIVVGTFELDARFWYDRNVVGRLLAVTMGASQEVNADDGNELYGLYHTACKGVGFEDALCSHYGLPFVSWKEYKAKWTDVWTMWKKRICDRLTTSYDELTYNSPNRRSSSFPEGNTLQSFWDEFGITKNKTIVDLESNYKFSALKQIPDLAALMNRLVSKSGIVMDLTLPNQHEQILGPKSTLLEQIYALGFNLIQLRLANDYNIGYTPGALPHAVVQDATSRRPAQHSHGSQTQHVRPSIKQIKESLVAMATSRNIGIMPEIALSTNAGGLYHAGFNVPCPSFTCRRGQGVQNITHPRYAAVAYSLVREVEEIATSGMIHLGSDERSGANECFLEAKGEKPDFESFENKLSYLLEFDSTMKNKIIRWSNEEGIDYPGRLGTTTQCREGDCRTETDDSGDWIATVDIQAGGPYGIYNAARDLALRKPFAIVAEVGKIDAASMKVHHVSQRLLAFAMGISDMKEWSRGMFEETFTHLCQFIFGNNTGCSDFAMSNEGIDEAASRPELNRKALCSERTSNTAHHIYRPEFQERVATVEIQPN